MHWDLTFSDVFAQGVLEHVVRCRTLEMLLHDGISLRILFWWTRWNAHCDEQTSCREEVKGRGDNDE